MTDTEQPTMGNEAPYPQVLADLVEQFTYRPGWSFTLSNVDRGQGSIGLTLSILVHTVDSYHPKEPKSVIHYMPVPPASFNERSWRRWLLEQVLLVDRHEACEFFQIGGEHPFAPHHGPGNDPYTIFEHGDPVDARTSFRGVVKDP